MSLMQTQSRACRDGLDLFVQQVRPKSEVAQGQYVCPLLVPIIQAEQAFKKITGEFRFHRLLKMSLLMLDEESLTDLTMAAMFLQLERQSEFHSERHDAPLSRSEQASI